jgi:hypothetical protein
MNSNEHFSLSTFTYTTKQVCSCSAISIFLIVVFIISPLSNYLITSTIMKIITLLLLSYTMYLNILQTEYLRKASTTKVSTEIGNQLTMNVVCSYVFSLFIGLLIIFVIKTFF